MSKTGYTSGYTLKAVLERIDRNKQAFYQARNEERKIVLGDHDSFATFYGMKPGELPSNQKVYSYTFSRTGGTSLARLFLLGEGFSFEDVFLDQQRDTGATPEEIAHNNMVLDAKKAMGAKVLHMLNEKAEEEIAKEVSRRIISLMPQYVEKVNGLVEHKYSNPLAVRTKDQLLCMRMAEFIFDLYQDTTVTDKYKEIMKNEAEKYHKDHPNEPKFDYERYGKIAYSLMSDRYHGRYKESIDAYLTGGEKSLHLTQLMIDAIGTKYSDSVREKNMQSGKTVQEAFTFNEETTTELMKGEFLPVSEDIRNHMLQAYTWDEITDALISGRLIDSLEVNVAKNGTLQSFSCLGVSYDMTNYMLTMPDENISQMELRNEMYQESISATKDASVYTPSTGDHFLALTGFTKEAFFDDTEDFGFRLSRQTAQGMIITNLLAKGMTLEEALDPSLKVEEKHQEALLFREMIKKPVPPKGTPDYENRYQQVMQYAVDGYWGAKDILASHIKHANSNLTAISNPVAIYTTSQGRCAYAAALITSDLAQEIAKGKPGVLLNQKSERKPTPSEQLTNLSVAANFVADAGEIAKFTNQVLAEKEFSTKALLKQAILAAAGRSYLENKVKDFQQQNQAGEQKELDYFQFITPQDLDTNNAVINAAGKLTKALIEEVEKRFSREDLAKMAINGELVKAVKIAQTKDGIASISMLGIKAAEVGDKILCTKEDGSKLSNLMDNETQKRYKQQLKKLIKVANDTNELLVFGSTQNYRDFIKAMNDMKDLLSDDNLSFEKLKKALEPVNSSIEKYRKDHQDFSKLDSFQKRRLQAMEKITDFSRSVDAFEKRVDSYEHTSLALSNLRKDRYKLEGIKLRGTYSEADGRMILNNKALAATENLYQMLVNGTTITADRKEGVIRDLKTIALSKLIEAEGKMQTDLQGGMLTQTVINNPDHIDDLIKNADIGGLSKMEAFLNPTLEVVEKLFRNDLITMETGAVIKDVYNKAKDERMKAEKVAQTDLIEPAKKEKAEPNKEIKAFS